MCALAFLAYVPTLGFQFVHDDRGQIVGNPAVHSWHYVPRYFIAHVWAGFSPSFLANQYRPVFLLWARINDAIFGLHPIGWHFTTVAAHVAATYAVICLAYSIFHEWPAALASGLIFGLHPVHIEAVAWISAVPEPLMAGLLICAYLCWCRATRKESNSRHWMTVSLCLYALALLTKETAVVLPLILGVSVWRQSTSPNAAKPAEWTQKCLQGLRLLLPYIFLTVAYLVVRTAALQGFSHPAARINWGTVILTWPSLLLFYARLLVWPVGLRPFYGLEYILHPTLRNTFMPALALLAIGGSLWRWASRSRAAALAITWMVFPLLPVLEVQVFGNGNFAHNRYLYLPSVGFSLLAAMALCNLKLGAKSMASSRSWQIGARFLLALLLGFAIQAQDRYYADDLAFYSFAYRHVEKPDAVIGMDYASALAERGDFDRAAGIYRELIQANPQMWSACFNLGYMDYQRGDLGSAREYLSRAAAGDPSNVGAAFYLGLTDFKLHDLAGAEENLRRTVALDPTARNHHFALGMVLRVEGNMPGALGEFTRELELNPGQRAAAEQIAAIKGQPPQK